MIALVCENSMCMQTKAVRSDSRSEELGCNESEPDHSDSSCDSSTTVPKSTSITQNENHLDAISLPAVSTTLLLTALMSLAFYTNHTYILLDTINYNMINPIILSASTLANRISNTGFYQAFSLVLISEIGDKTFFIAALLAMKTGKVVSFTGAIIALAAMTMLSVIIGQLFHAVPVGISQGIPFKDLAAVLAFAFFGIKTLKESSELEDGDSSGIEEEYADAKEAVKCSRTIKQVTAWGKIVSTFGLVFAAEFGDRSFISTIALSAAQNPVSVAFGAVAGHAIATSIAVTGGSYIASYISEKRIGFIGGSLFIFFSITTCFGLF